MRLDARFWLAEKALLSSLMCWLAACDLHTALPYPASTSTLPTSRNTRDTCYETASSRSRRYCWSGLEQNSSSVRPSHRGLTGEREVDRHTRSLSLSHTHTHTHMHEHLRGLLNIATCPCLSILHPRYTRGACRRMLGAWLRPGIDVARLEQRTENHQQQAECT